MGTIDDCKLKIVRAEKHLDELTAEFDRVAKRKPYKFIWDHRPDVPGELGIYVRVNEEPPAYLGAILGDFLQNCRSVLDYIATGLDRAAGRSGFTNYFPIFDNRAAFQDEVARKLNHWGANLAIVEGVQPFNSTRRPISTHPALILHRLSRTDKHQNLTPTFVMPHTFEVVLVYENGDEVTLEGIKPDVVEEIHDNAKIAQVHIPPPPGGGKVEVKSHLALSLMFGPSESYGDATRPVLTWVRDEVLARFEPALQKLGV